jgi:hypothetical protein
MSDFLDFIIKLAKATIWVSIALFFVTCSVGAAFTPDVNIEIADVALEDLPDRFEIEVIESEDSDRIVITKTQEFEADVQ